MAEITPLDRDEAFSPSQIGHDLVRLSDRIEDCVVIAMLDGELVLWSTQQQRWERIGMVSQILHQLVADLTSS